MKNKWIAISCVFAMILGVHAKSFAALEESKITQVVMLGTGTPIPDPSRSGPAVAIIVNEQPYIVDLGPGIVRQIASMTPRFGGAIKALEKEKLTHAFVTHLHSDHTAGFAEFVLLPWISGRNEPLEVYGPEGVIEMAHHVLKAYDHDIKYRLYGSEPSNNQGWRVNAHAVQEGVIYKDENVTVEAFPVVHGSWPDAFGYRFTTPDRVIVVSGDSSPNDGIAKYAKNADILIHEVYSEKGLKTRKPFWQNYHQKNHTSGVDLGKLAAAANVKKLILTHILFMGSTGEQIVKEVQSEFNGEVVLANDRDVY